MHTLSWTSRVVSRVLLSGVTNFYVETQLNRKRDSHLVYAICGFPKDFNKNSQLIPGRFGDDAWFAVRCKTADVIGVADGVGGWKRYGIDSGEFSSFLMRTCEKLVETGKFIPTDAADLLGRSYRELLESKRPILGSSTACLVIFNKETSSLFTANIGDSGFLVVRQGQIVHRSEEQQHYFNAPFQLSLPPPNHTRSVLRDEPESASTSTFPVEDGDVILVATDGVFDNVPEAYLIPEMSKLQGEQDDAKIQVVANSIAFMARKLAFSKDIPSPFTKRAHENGIKSSGGKPDDITVLIATVVL